MAGKNPNSGQLKVVIAGGGVAAVEAALALRDLANSAIDLVLLAPNTELVYRPMTVREPFAYARAQRYQLQPIARDVSAELVPDALARVEADRRIVHAAGGAALPYDALILALGGRIEARYRQALTIDDRRMDETFHGLIQDIEGGYVKRLAFVVPPRMAWPLPIYELALMAAARAYDMNVHISATVITPEEAPLALFGQQASTAISGLLHLAGITTVTSAYAEIPATGHVVVHPGDRRLQFDRIVALPELFGPAVPGVPATEHGFIPVDLHCKVQGVEGVYAAGDATDFAVKHGGIAAQQADVAAEAIAQVAGISLEPKRFDPVIHGMLLTGGRPKYLTAHITGGHGLSSSVSDAPIWSPGTKIAARYLAPYLQQKDRAAADPTALTP